MTNKKAAMGAVLFTGLFFSQGWATEPSLLEQADAAYAKREDVPQAKIAMVNYEKAATDPKLAVEALWKASRAAYWVADHAPTRADKLAGFQAGMDLANKAIALNADSVDAHYWLGCNQGSYGDTKGVMKSLSMVKPIRHEMAEVIRLNDKYDGGGAYRVLAVVDYKVPGLMGGSKKRAREELEKTLAMDPHQPFTHYYWAEFYKIMGEKDKKKAALETLNTMTAPPDLEPELKMLREKAAKELK